MPVDKNKWREMMVESGRLPDENGYWHYNPQAIKNPVSLSDDEQE